MSGESVDRALAYSLQDRLQELSLAMDPPERLEEAEEIRPALKDGFPVRAPLVDIALTSTSAHHRGEFFLLFLPQGTSSSMPLSSLRKIPPERLLILAPEISERSAQHFRGIHANFLDSAGKAWIIFPGVHIDVRGRRTRLRIPKKASGQSLFTPPRRAQVVFALLTWGHLLDAPQRVLAACAGVSLGVVHETLTLLEEQGFLRRLPQGSRLEREDDLRKLWLNSYPTSLGPKLSLRALEGSLASVESDSTTTLVSGESAVRELLAPETLTLYTSRNPVELAVENRWRSAPENQANIFIRRKFWLEPEAPLPGTDSDTWAVPDLLIEADLLASGDPRQLEAAELLRSGGR